MQGRNSRQFMLVLGFIAVVGFAGCKKPVASSHPTSAPAPTSAQPTVTLNATPTAVKAGDTVTLSWTSTDATDADIEPGVGKVALQGSTPVNPADSTTYTITATGPGGSATATARVTVGGGAAVAPPPTSNNQSMTELFEQNVKDAFFDFNKSDLRGDAREALTRTAEFLRSYPQVRVTIEGHCDDRGSTEYNIGLGERRAQAAKNYLISLGITADRMDTVSWGKERPFCTEQTDACWQENRRAHFVAAH
ncbi:MAG TPA: peptidoglycan-associated lipoprotein Pal [Candidatus Acidoferrales bacterium]